MVMNALLGNVLGNVLGGPKPAQGLTQAPFKMHLNVTDGLPAAVYGTSALVAAIIAAMAAAGPFQLIWQTIVPPQQKMRWGFGSPGSPQNQGYMWFYSADNGTNITLGVLRLVQSNARGTDIRTVLEMSDAQLHTPIAAGAGVTPTALPIIDKMSMIALPEQKSFPLVGEDSLLQLYYRVITVATAEDIADFSIPVTVFQ